MFYEILSVCDCDRVSKLCYQIQRDTGPSYSVEYSSFSVGPEADNGRAVIT